MLVALSIPVMITQCVMLTLGLSYVGPISWWLWLLLGPFHYGMVRRTLVFIGIW